MSLPFKSFQKIDAHVHFNSRYGAVASLGEAYHFRFLSINTDVPFFPALKEQEEIILDLQDQYSDRVSFLTSFPVDTWAEKSWQAETIGRIKRSIANGAKGVKIWKNIGMDLKDPDGSFVMIDHPRLDGLFNYLEAQQIPFLGHQGEPKNCWLPIEEMTVKQDQQYFANHPEYHMYLHPEYPSYEAHIEARDHRCSKHPQLTFVAAHIASLEWSIEKASRRLDRFPHMHVDLADRICHLQHQAKTNWKGVRQFCIDYQDRIIYGTDVIESEEVDPEVIKKTIIERWTRHWQFFSTDEHMTAPKVYGTFQGLALPESVLQKIYYQNAVRVYFS